MAQTDAVPNAAAVAKLAEELETASEAYKDAYNAAQAARRAETKARNTVNEAQKKFDAAVTALKETAPTDSDWHTAQLPKHEVQ